MVTNYNSTKGPNDSDVNQSIVQEFVEVYNQLLGRRGLGFAQQFATSIFNAHLGHTITKHTLEAAVALADAHPTNGHLENLPAVVSTIYALTPEKARETRMQFLEEIKKDPSVDMSALETRARQYVPSHEAICEYVVGLPHDHISLIVKSETTDWNAIALQYPRFADQIAHFARLEKQFNCRLSEYLPPPSRQ